VSKFRVVGIPFLFFAMAWLGVAGLAVSLLWNRLMPAIFHLPAITFLQALGLLILSRILCGGFRGWGSRMRKSRWVRGWKDLTPEERQRFRRAMGSEIPEGFERREMAND